MSILLTTFKSSKAYKPRKYSLIFDLKQKQKGKQNKVTTSSKIQNIVAIQLMSLKRIKVFCNECFFK